MPQFLATCAKGFVEVLETELKEIGVGKTERIPGGVLFEGNWELCYKVNLHSRIANRVLKPILEFTAYDGDELYGQLMKHDFTKYISHSKSIRVEASVDECKIHDQRFLAMRTKDAVVDQFREKSGERPNVDNTNPDLRIFIKGKKNQFQVAIDTSGDSLFLRGYRKSAGEAPLKETLAAGLIRMAEWKMDRPIVDPLCGSGTIVIEAALMALKIAPGTLRSHFGFQNFHLFDEQLWEQLVEEAISQELEDLPFKLYGSDIDRRVIQYAKENARRAGVDHVVQFKTESVATVTPEVEGALIVTNPPYAVRLGDEDNLRDVYRDLSYSLKQRFKGTDAWLLSGNRDLIVDLKLKSSRKHFVYNGPIECRFLKYAIN